MKRPAMVELKDGLFHVLYSEQVDLASSFLRFQEHYESPNTDFRGKVFTLDQYREWYIEQKGSFSYYTDWSGFNIPDYVLPEFRKGAFDPLSEGEQILLEVFNQAECKAPHYFIGTAGCDYTLRHEIAHALWYLDKPYRAEMEGLIASLSPELISKFQEELPEVGYCDDVLDDELQAYLATRGPMKSGEGLSPADASIADKMSAALDAAAP